jgi:hypothetical protein
MNFSKELLFAVGFIVVMIIFIQFVSYRMLQKKIKLEVAKQFLIEKKKMSLNQQQDSNNNLDVNLNNKIETTNKEEDMETYDIDTPTENDIDSNADSYVNPLHSEKNVTDTDEEK